MIDSIFWTVDDALTGACSMDDVGTKKPAEPSLPLTPSGGPDMSPSERLKHDALLAYTALGGPEYLKRNPELLDRALLKMIADPDKKMDASVKIVIEAPWMSPDRLSYFKRQEVIDVSATDASAPKGWRPEDDRKTPELPLMRAEDPPEPGTARAVEASLAAKAK